jgi:hypothetical protein
MNQGTAFDQMSPKPSVTDPLGHGAQTVYPKHLHQAGVSEDNGPLYVVVTTPEEEAAAIADGWLLEKPSPTLEPPRKPTAPAEAPTHPRRR